MVELGIASTSFAGSAIGAQAGKTLGKVRPPALDTLQLLERCHEYGAAGIQAEIHGDTTRLRDRAAELGMWVEAMISVRDADADEIERAILRAKEAGCTLARDGLLAGRRYDSFRSTAEWNEWVERSEAALGRAVPIFEKHKFTLALENHKDWTLEQYAGLLRTYASEHFGACIDFGNNLSLLDDPMEFIETVAPYAKSTHVKDVAVEPCAEGFLMAEVVLGQGLLDLPRAIGLLRKANARLRLSLEMITRDPLEVPCLTDRYWAAFPERNGIHLARTMRLLNEKKSSAPLARVEGLGGEEHTRLEAQNVQDCMRYAANMTLVN